MMKINTLKKGAKTTLVFGMSALMAATPVLSAIPVYAADAASDADAEDSKKDTEKDSKAEKTVTTDTKEDKTAVSKEETVYVKADAKGNVEKTTVSSRLVNAGLYKNVEDVSDLDDIKNVKGDEEFTASGNKLTWSTDGADIYYQGTTDKDLPVGVSFTYYLDGKEMKAEDLVGKSGKLTIKVKYENYSKNTIDVDGNKVDINTPFIMMTGMILPSENFENVEIDHGKVISDGTRSIVLGYGMPGLADTLKLKDLDLNLDIDTDDDDDEKDEKTLEERLDEVDIPDTLEITADVTDFTLDNTFTLAASDLFEDLDTTDFFSVDDLNDAMAEIEDASLQLVDGSKELSDGTVTLDSSYGEFNDGITTLKDGVDQLVSGGGTLSSAVTTYTDGVKTLASGTVAYVDGVEQLAAGASKLSTLADGVDQVNSGAKALATYFDGAGDTDVVAGAKKLAAGTKQLNDTLSQASDLLSSLPQLLQMGQSLVTEASGATEALNNLQSSLTTLSTSLSTLQTTLSAVKAAVDAKNTEIDAHNESDATAISELQAALDSLPSTATGSQTVTDTPDENGNAESHEVSVEVSVDSSAARAQIEAAISQLQSNQISKLDTSTLDACIKSIDTMLQGISAAASSLGDLPSKVQEMGTALSKASEQMQSLSGKTEQIQTLSKSVATLDAGMQNLSAAISGDLKNGIDQLAAGTGSLKSGTDSAISSLNSGLGQLTANDAKLKAGANQLITASDQLASGSKTLITGMDSLSSGTSTLASASGQVADGISQLADGAGQLSDGMAEFDEKAIKKICNMFDGDLEDLLDRVKAISDEKAAYTNFSGKADGMESSVKFIIETEAIE